MTISIQPITNIAATIERVLPLIEGHYDELARNKSVMRLKPDAHKYACAEAAGLLLAVGAYDAGEMVGYSVSLIDNHLHYSDLRYASNDVLFIRPSHRKGRLGLQLIRETERLARARGAKLVLWHAKEGTSLQALMSRLGYAVQDVIYSKEL